MRLLGIDFAPLCLPLQRRAETLAALAWIFLMLLGAMTSWSLFIWALVFSSAFRLPCLLYAAWMYWDRSSVESGQRRSKWVRGWSWWKYLCAYFPVRLVKTAELPSDRSYLFVTFPHGILSLGPFCAFSTDGCDFGKVFPGLTPHIATLNMHFVTPLIRELSLALGSLPATEDVMVRCLSSPGKAICLVAGGAAEAFHSSPGDYKILLARRKGFIRVALKSGASLVPTIAFGEPDVYEQISCAPGSFLRWTQDQYKKMTGIAPVYLKGRGVFQYTWGLLPFRKSITVVAGKPIHVEKIENPSKEDINALHETFSKHWLALFESEKRKTLQGDRKVVLL